MAKASAVPADGVRVGPVVDGEKKPQFGTPRTAGAMGDLPRVCDELERVPAGAPFKRFKVRADNFVSFGKPRYILAANREDAKACYLAQPNGIADHLSNLKKQGYKELAEPILVVTELAD